MPKITIGMAHYEDFDGAYFTIQAMRLNEALLMPETEFVVVDNSPHSQQVAPMLRTLVERHARTGTAGAKYVPMTTPVGTSASRQRIFDEASGDVVLVLDCHVLLVPGALSRLVEFAETEDFRGIWSGPLLMDDCRTVQTHFDPFWRAEMFGTWGQAWQCPCGGVRFSMTQQGPQAVPHLLDGLDVVPLTSCGECGREIPRPEWNGFYQKLVAAKYRPLGIDADDPPFSVPGQGLGLFACRREDWVGFNKDAVGFGGEELYVHEKFRMTGMGAYCLPFLKWMHRFGRPAGVKYPLTRWNKVRNYVLEFNELGLDLEPVRKHFVDGKLLSREQWDYLVKDPVHRVKSPDEPKTCIPCNGAKSDDDWAAYKTMDELYAKVESTPRDLDRHLAKLRELASQVSHVTEFSKRRESLVALAAGKPKRLVSHNLELGPLSQRVQDLAGLESMTVHKNQSAQVDGIEPTDLLFIDSQHTAKRLGEELRKYAPKVSRYIVLHDTSTYGTKGEDGGPGLLPALREFVRDNPKWSVVHHTKEQHGLTVLACRDEDKPKLPSKIKMAGNFAKAVAKHVATGAKHASKGLLQARLETCSLCVHRKDDRCTVCGCFVETKAAMKDQECPLALWPTE